MSKTSLIQNEGTEFHANLAPLKDFAIIKLQCQNANRIQLYRLTPKLTFHYKISSLFPHSSKQQSLDDGSPIKLCMKANMHNSELALIRNKLDPIEVSYAFLRFHGNLDDQLYIIKWVQQYYLHLYCFPLLANRMDEYFPNMGSMIN